MSSPATRAAEPPRLPQAGLALSCAALIGVLLAAAAPVAAWKLNEHGNLGLAAVGLGWLLCTASSVAALVISVAFAGTPNALAANLGCMGIRMGAPLLGLAILPNLLPHLASAGLLHSILILYLVGLLAETMLAVRHAGVQVRSQKSEDRSGVAPVSNQQSAISNLP